METTADYYATLRVRPDSDEAALRQAYHALMRRYHPDVNVGDDAADQCQAINEAYACLRDPDRRAAYDLKRRAYQRHRRPSLSSSPHAYQTARSAAFAERIDAASTIESRGWKLAIIGFAIVMTAITFTITSAVDTRVAAPPPAAKPDRSIHVQLKADPQRATTQR